MPESHRISIRVHTPLLEWIERQAVENESPSKTVQRLIVELATSEGVVLGDRIDRLDDRISQINDSVNERLAALESVLADSEDTRLKRDTGNFHEPKTNKESSGVYSRSFVRVACERLAKEFQDEERLSDT